MEFNEEDPPRVVLNRNPETIGLPSIVAVLVAQLQRSSSNVDLLY
jgi:hypothetical protein